MYTCMSNNSGFLNVGRKVCLNVYLESKPIFHIEYMLGKYEFALVYGINATLSRTNLKSS